MVRARMAVWEFSEPRRVRNARIFSLSSWTVSLGVRSSATRITGSRVSRDSSLPPRQRISRLEISTTSAARACMYSSVMVENIWEKESEVRSTAYSAFTRWVWIMWLTLLQ